MAAQQTSYSLEPATNGLAGQLADTRNALIDGFRNDLAASAEAAYGLAVCKSTDSDDRGFGLCGTARQFLGVLAHQNDSERSSTATGLANKEFGNVMRKGRIWVKVVEAVTTASTVKVFVADHSGTLANAVEGAFGDTAVTAKTATLANSRYLTAASAGETALLEIDTAPVLLTAD